MNFNNCDALCIYHLDWRHSTVASISIKCAFVKTFEAIDMEKYEVHIQISPEGSAKNETFSENFNRCLMMELIPDPFFVWSVLAFRRRKSKWSEIRFPSTLLFEQFSCFPILPLCVVYRLFGCGTLWHPSASPLILFPLCWWTSPSCRPHAFHLACLKWQCDYKNIIIPCIFNNTIEWINVSGLSKLTIYIYDIPTPITYDKIVIIISGGHNSRYNTFHYVQNYLQVHPIYEVISRPYTVCNHTDTIIDPLTLWRLTTTIVVVPHR